MKDPNDYNQYKRWELIIMLTILKTIKFCNSKVGEFILSFILVSIPLLLFLGTSTVVWMIILLTHFFSLITVGKLRSDLDKWELDDEINKEIRSCKSALKQKKSK